MEHVRDDDLERYYLGMITDEAELAQLEQHLLACPQCVDRAEESDAYVDAMRAAIIRGNFDREFTVGDPAERLLNPSRKSARR
jgi:hypothetical protein